VGSAGALPDRPARESTPRNIDEEVIDSEPGDSRRLALEATKEATAMTDDNDPIPADKQPVQPPADGDIELVTIAGVTYAFHTEVTTYVLPNPVVRTEVTTYKGPYVLLDPPKTTTEGGDDDD
jgi:hypothetical protein